MDFGQVARDLGISESQVQRTVELLDDGNTVPFVTRFRKDQTGALDEEQIRKIQDRVEKLRALVDRRQTIRKSIEVQGKLTADLAASIESAKTLKALEDLYLPFKPRKRSLASEARERGLEPFAEQLISGAITGSLDEAAAALVNPDVGLKAVEDVLQGTSYLVAEHFAEHPELREVIRRMMWNDCRLRSQKMEASDEEDSDLADDAQANPTAAATTTDAATTDAATTDAATTDAATTADAATTDAATTDAAATAESAVGEAETTEPVAAKPATEPATTEATTETAVTDTAPAEAAAVETGTTEPVATETANAEATTAEAAPTEPATTEATTTEPATTEPATTEPATTEATAETATTEPAAAESGTAKPEPPSAPPSAPVKTLVDEASRVREMRRVARREKRRKKREKLVAAFKDYFDYSEKIRQIPPHRVLAINRGERSRVLRVKIEFDSTPLPAEAEKLLIPEGHPQSEYLSRCVRDGLQRLAVPGIEREIRRELTEQAELQAVSVFVRNLRNLLLQPPVRQHRILSIDPGYRSGCKLAMLDECGNVVAHDLVFIVGKKADIPGAKQRLVELVGQHEASVIAIGNGAACREAEQIVSALLSDELKERDVAYVIVNEAGASFYSTSSVGREELPDLDPVTRSAVSIGRRLLDPLSELVKINPANIGVGLYQHDVKAKHLRDSLDAVVESCVNFVGADVNTASPALLCYVSGLNQLSARRIYEHRLEHGAFKTRDEILKVSGVGEGSYVQAAGFLKVANGENRLDATWIHPESYPIAERVLEKLGIQVGDPVGEVNAAEMARELEVGEHLLADILAALARPGHDPRQDLPAPIFRRGIVKLEDLEPGMDLDGTVLNVVDFGAFVDIGLSDSGLVHISRLADRYIKDPHEVVSVGDVLKVWVVEVDQKRRRVSLTAIAPGSERPARPPRGKGKRGKAADGTQSGGDSGGEGRGKKSGGEQSRRKRHQRSQSRPPSPKHKSREYVQAKKKPAPPITEGMSEGSEPMRSFSDLAQFFEKNQDQDKPPEKSEGSE